MKWLARTLGTEHAWQTGAEPIGDTDRAGARDIHPLSPVKDLPLSRRQLVEIAKALSRRPKILILDEATSALTAGDVERVFRVLKQLRSEGLAIVCISHRMHEVAKLADDCPGFSQWSVRRDVQFRDEERRSDRGVDDRAGI